MYAIETLELKLLTGQDLEEIRDFLYEKDLSDYMLESYEVNPFGVLVLTFKREATE